MFEVRTNTRRTTKPRRLLVLAYNQLGDVVPFDEAGWNLGDSSVLEVRLSQVQNRAIVEVMDRGQGIPLEAREYLKSTDPASLLLAIRVAALGSTYLEPQGVAAKHSASDHTQAATKAVRQG
jgi:hypothetical protein